MAHPDCGVKSSKPNILLILADQFRHDAIGAVSSYARTPYLDALARDGVLFERAYCNAPECIPSRFSFALGQYPHQTGVWFNGHVGALNPAVPNWMKSIRARGYQTALIGKTHLHPHGGDLRDREELMARLGLDHADEIAGPRSNRGTLSHMTAGWEAKGLWQAYRDDLNDRFAAKAHIVRPSALPIEDYYDTYVGRRTAEYLETCPDNEPWLCWMSFAGPHEPWDAPEPYASHFSPDDAPKAIPRMDGAETVRGLARRAFQSSKHSPEGLTDADVGLMRASYAGSVELIDHEIGRVLSVLERRNMLDNTLIVFTADHGEMNGDQGLIYKSTFFEQAIRVPLIVRPPRQSQVDQGRRHQEPVSLVDLARTLVETAGGMVPQSFVGKSLPLAGEDVTGAFALIEYDGFHCIVTSQWKAEFDPDGELTLLFWNGDEQTNLAGVDAEGEAICRALLDRRLAETPPDVIPAQVPLELALEPAGGTPAALP